MHPPELEVEGSPPSLDLEGIAVEAHVSQVAAHPQVRALMRAAQRALGLEGGVVEGRDIATVVFPDAPVKLYLVADPAERIERRARQRDGAGDQIGTALERRDERDAKVNPFEPPDDAIVIDTTGLDIEDTLAAALEIVRPRGAGAVAVTGPGLPRVAVIGRQNVGKSTLVNRLFGRREAIAHDMPGVTRDRVEVEATWRGRRFGLVDTAGYLAQATGVEALARGQADRAIAEADLILLVVDAPAGITEEDAALARRLRRSPVPVLLVANKVDTDREESDATAFNRLGLGEPFAVSSMHGRATGDLLDRIVALLPDAPHERDGEPDEEPRFALVGRPNVGKSSLFNRLVGEERSVVFEEAGTTRDAVDAVVEWPGGPVRFVDTAGMRRQVKVRGVEYFSFVRATEAIERAHVVVLVIDASEGFTVEDKKIVNRVMDEGRAFIARREQVGSGRGEGSHVQDPRGDPSARSPTRP